MARWFFVAAVGSGIATGMPLHAQPGLSGSARDLLAQAYLALDHLVDAKPLSSSLREPFNRAFDNATLAFFSGRLDEASRTLDSLATLLEPDHVIRARLLDSARATLRRLAGERRLLLLEEGDSIAYHLEVPREAATRPVPLVVALHGAGGDERMFFAGYGAGRIRHLARERGVAVVTPLTTALANRPDRLDALLGEVGRAIRVDEDRIYLVGHSLGAGAAWGLALARRDRVAAVACLAGACGPARATSASAGPAPPPPLLVVAGEVDPLATPTRLEAGVTAAQAAGVRAEFRVAAGWGHTLVVGEALPDVLDWFLRVRRER